MIATYFVLTLFCLSCDPIQSYQVHDIEAIEPGGSLIDADGNCQDMGFVLSGEYRRANMAYGTFKSEVAAFKSDIVFTCTKESAEF